MNDDKTTETLDVRIMDLPCPNCGGTDYYCAREVDDELARVDGDWYDSVWMTLHMADRVNRAREFMERGDLKMADKMLNDAVTEPPERIAAWRKEQQAATIRAFVERVNRRAEQKMAQTGKLEGSHYAAMQIELAALES